MTDRQYHRLLTVFGLTYCGLAFAVWMAIATLPFWR